MTDRAGTALYHRIISFDYRDMERAALMVEVWQTTPWVINVYTGRCAEQRERQIIHWCFEQLGDQSSPIHGRSGIWTRGGATIDGWTWFGFATEADMQRFIAAWPTPDGIVDPQRAAFAADEVNQ